ncbi:MAG: hypothetical protein R3B93_08385 [Bacteroidia bacterium]
MKHPIIPPTLLPPKIWAGLIIVFLLLPSVSFAQEYEHVLYLNNGWVLHGKITSIPTDSMVSIRTEDRNIFVFPNSEVDSQVIQLKPDLKTQKRISSNTVQYRNKGYFILFQAGTLMGNAYSEEQKNSVFNPEMVNGYKFNRFLSVGGGIGINMINDGAILPAFIDIRGDLLKQKATPHYFIRGGYSIPLYTREEQFWGWGEPVFEDFKADGGYMFEGGLGMKIHTPSGLAYLFTGGYRVQTLTERYNSFGNRIEQFYTFQRISLSFGLMF